MNKKPKNLNQNEREVDPNITIPKLSPKKGAASISPKKVGFQGVEVRLYKRSHGGGGGVPAKGTNSIRSSFIVVGAYPLGLDWDYLKDETMIRSVSDFEEEKHDPDHLERIPEKKRKELLEEYDER